MAMVVRAHGPVARLGMFWSSSLLAARLIWPRREYRENSMCYCMKDCRRAIQVNQVFVAMVESEEHLLLNRQHAPSFLLAAIFHGFCTIIFFSISLDKQELVGLSY